MQEIIHVSKKIVGCQPQYKVDCLHGQEHPLGIELEDYHLMHIGFTRTKEVLMWRDSPTDFDSAINESDSELIKNFSKRPVINWAIANSFDGLYIDKKVDEYGLHHVYNFSVYMKGVHCTYWKLKFK